MFRYYIISFIVILGGLGIVNSLMINFNNLVKIGKDLNDNN